MPRYFTASERKHAITVQQRDSLLRDVTSLLPSRLIGSAPLQEHLHSYRYCTRPGGFEFDIGESL